MASRGFGTFISASIRPVRKLDLGSQTKTRRDKKDQTRQTVRENRQFNIHQTVRHIGAGRAKKFDANADSVLLVLTMRLAATTANIFPTEEDKQTKPLLSLRVSILPEYQDNYASTCSCFPPLLLDRQPMDNKRPHSHEYSQVYTSPRPCTFPRALLVSVPPSLARPSSPRVHADDEPSYARAYLHIHPLTAS